MRDKKRPEPGKKKTGGPGKILVKRFFLWTAFFVSVCLAIIAVIVNFRPPDNEFEGTIPRDILIEDKIPKIAIIIDDIGYNKKIPLALSNLSYDITFSFLPGTAFGKYLLKELNEKGCQIMLHQPMEPFTPGVNPGPSAIMSRMSPDILVEQLKRNISAVPGIAGVNNHMGSRITSDPETMDHIFAVLKEMNLFFIDSRTSSESRCRESAERAGIKFGQRDVFLDNLKEPDYIRGQIHKLIKIAEKKGSAVGIGHPYKVTLETLESELPKFKDRIEIVPAGTLTYFLR